MINNQKSLSEVFKELEATKNRQLEEYKNIKRNQEQASFIFQVKHRTRMDNIRLIVIVLLFLLIVSMFSSNYIFAKDLETDEARSAIGTYEENKEITDVYKIISENISVSYQKEIFDREEEIEFETEYVENKDLPKDENIVLQEGILGMKTVTYVRSYENNEVTEENAIGSIVVQEPQKMIVEVGTSEILKKYNIHIGDNLFVSQDIDLRKEANSEAESILTVPMYYDVKTIEVIEDSWLKVKYNNEEGYIYCDYLTSEALTPGIAETSRKKKILDKVDFNMNLNEPSGLLESDFEKVFANHTKDKNNVFKENYKAFKKVEDKYKVNGVFIASIAIHESNWGNSNISLQKKNLFGFGAYDSSPYDSAVTFDTYEEGIDRVAKWLAVNYLNPSGTVLNSGETASGRYYNGANVSGVNTRYASDTGWASKVFETMKSIYNSI